ncbi:MAG: aldehyde dehydrogenase family protein [Hyalangium sp.]|uniref:aldehyde dehydrogenase family protein n=1 Tax=Hyalangium sp. TaxID=2028555 RepID=UPI00389A5978
MISNILNGRFVAAEGSRKAGAWAIPRTAPSDVGFALKCAHSAPSPEPRDPVPLLRAIGREGLWITAAQMREISAATGSPLRYVRASVARFNEWLGRIDAYLDRVGRWSGGELTMGGVTYCGGLTSMLVLAGDEVTLAPWALAHAVLAGARVIAKPSNAEPLSAFLFVRALLEQGLKGGPNLLYLDSSSEEDRAAMQRLVSSTEQSVVFGEDATVQAIYGPLAFRPNHKAIPYWSGRSGAIILPDADLAAAARDLIAGMTMDRGNRCDSTKRVYAPRGFAGDLERLLIESASRLHRGEAADERTELGVLDEHARQIAERGAAGSQILYDRELLIARCTDLSPLITEEMPYPALGIRYYDDGEDPFELANQSVRQAPTRRALVISIFTQDQAAFRHGAQRLNAYKVLQNLPTSHADLFSPHQGMHLFQELMRPKAIIQARFPQE